jgi:hypothetical protein
MTTDVAERLAGAKQPLPPHPKIVVLRDVLYERSEVRDPERGRQVVYVGEWQRSSKP